MAHLEEQRRDQMWGFDFLLILTASNKGSLQIQSVGIESLSIV
jgi:hypothetical protein